MYEYKEVKISKYLHSGFLIQTQTYNYYIDPFKIPDNQPPADIIFISHEHFDHFDPESIKKIYKHGTLIVGNTLTKMALLDSDLKDIVEISNFIEVEPCASGSIGDLKYTCVEAYNINKFRSPGIPFHPKENKGIAFILDVYIQNAKGQKEKVRIFHLGDSDFLKEHHGIPEVDILLIPVSGTYVMTSQEAIEAVNFIDPKVVIPMHFDAGIAGSSNDAEELKANTSSEVVILQPLK